MHLRQISDGGMSPHQFQILGHAPQQKFLTCVPGSVVLQRIPSSSLVPHRELLTYTSLSRAPSSSDKIHHAPKSTNELFLVPLSAAELNLRSDPTCSTVLCQGSICITFTSYSYTVVHIIYELLSLFVFLIRY